jgi:uncharacterized protein YwgA
MKRGQRFAMLLLLDKEMLHQGSWCGETHIQKGTFLLQELLPWESDYRFVLYKHGPFSFELRDDLSEMQADGLLNLVARQQGYGPSYLPSSDADGFLARYPKTTARFEAPVKFIAKQLGDKGVAELERISTALYIKNRSELISTRDRAAELVRLKPHIPPSEALTATEEVDRLVESMQAR